MTDEKLDTNIGEPPFPGTPPTDCPLCPRLVAYRAEQRLRHPGWWNAPVPPLGDAQARLAIVGLAPGLKGANRTGQPFHGDDAGKLLFATLAELGLASETPEGWRAPGLFITNAVACAPPGNLPETAEKHACRAFLAEQLAALPGLKVVVALGETAHQAAIKAIGGKLPKYRFGHGVVHKLPSGVMLVDSYHPSRLNLNTGTITPEMLRDVLAAAATMATGPSAALIVADINATVAEVQPVAISDADSMAIAAAGLAAADAATRDN